jgi:hypothetical protein
VRPKDKNLTGLAAINRELLARAEAMEPSRRVVLDIDGIEVSVYGEQEQSGLICEQLRTAPESKKRRASPRFHRSEPNCSTS